MNSAQNWSKKQYSCDIAPLMNGYVKVSRLIKLNWSKKKGEHAHAANNPSLPPQPPPPPPPVPAVTEHNN